MVICVPKGNDHKTSSGFWEDSTRLPEYYDGTYNYLKSLGLEEIDNEIHYGVDAARLIKPMYENRVNELQDAGIGIELNQLLDMYNDSFIQDK